MGKPFAGVHIPAGKGHFQPFCFTKRRKCPHEFESNASKIGVEMRSKWPKQGQNGTNMGQGPKQDQNRVNIGRKWVKMGPKMGQNGSK